MEEFPPLHKQDIDKERLLFLIKELDRSIDGIQRKTKLYCLGGTLLALSNLRAFSKDIDFIVSREDWRILSGALSELEQKYQVRFDVFPEGQLPNYNYTYFSVNAKKLHYNFNHVELYVLDKVDFVLTKALAGRGRDYEDISSIVLDENDLSKNELINRFNMVKPLAGKEEEILRKFNEFISKFYS